MSDTLSGRGLLCFVLVCVAIPGTVFSIDFFKLKEDVISNSWKKFGPFYIQPAFLLENAGYNSNIFTYDDTVVPDYRADIGVNMNISSFIGNRFIIQVDEKPYYTWYAEQKDQEYFNNNLKFSLHTWIGKFNMSYSYSYSNVKNRPSSEFGTEVISNNYSHSLSVDYGKHDVFFLTAAYEENRSRFSNEGYFENVDLSTRMNRDFTSRSLMASKVIFTRTQLYLKGENYKYSYNFETLRDGSGSKLSLGIRFPEVGPLSGEFAAGMNWFDPGGEGEWFNRPFGFGEVTVRPLRYVRIHLGYRIDNEYSFWAEDAFYYERSWNAGIDLYLSSKLKVGYKYKGGESSYYYLSGESVGREDASSQSGFFLGYRISGSLGFGLQYTRYSLRTNVIDFSRSYNFIGGYVTHDF